MDTTSDPFDSLPSLTRLRAFAEVSRRTSISRASQELRRSQSSVSQSIRRLENELGVTLFSRTTHGSYLTEAGKVLQWRTDRCFGRIEAALRDVLNDTAADEARITTTARRITRAHIRALSTVHDHNSFAQAARYAQVSLTTLHRAARDLEKKIGRELFVSTAQGITTSTLGARLANQLQLAVRELEWAGEEIQSQRGSLGGKLLVGSLLLAGNQFVAVGLDRFVTAYPEARVHLVHGSYDALLAKLMGGSIDFLVGLLKNPPPTDQVVEEALGLDPYVIAVRRGHPLLRKKRITPDDLRAAEWVAPRPSSQRWAPFRSIFEGGTLPPYSVETHSLLTLLVLLGRSDRLALLTLSELAVDERLGNQLTTLDFKIDKPPAALGVTTRADWEPTSLQRTFLHFLRSQGTGLQGPQPR